MDRSAPLETTVHHVKTRLDLQPDSFVMLDCREPWEYEAAHISGSLLLPLSELAARYGELESIRERSIVVLCHHGQRSLQLSQWLRRQGFLDVSSMAGGIDQWSLEVDPSVPRY
jgi:rhodanese-related sulfurtransferase